MNGSELRAQAVAEMSARGIDEALIGQVVDTFYARIRRDALLGPIFQAAIGEDWTAHLAKMRDFWSSVLLMTGRYSGKPMQVHVGLPGLVDGHFEHWLSLFRATVDELCSPEAAAAFLERAHRIAESLRLDLAFHRGELPPPRFAVR